MAGMAGSVIQFKSPSEASKLEPTIVILLNDHIVKLFSKYLFIFIDLPCTTFCQKKTYCSEQWLTQRFNWSKC